MLTRRHALTGVLATLVTSCEPEFAVAATEPESFLDYMRRVYPTEDWQPHWGRIDWEPTNIGGEPWMRCTVSKTGGKTVWGFTPSKDFDWERKHLETTLIDKVMRRT